MPIDLLCLDADDTLWHNMRHFDAAERAFFEILAPFAASDIARAWLEATSARNLALYGYGVKSFTLSMIETATEICGDALPARSVRAILAAGRDLLAHPIELLDGVEETIARLAATRRLVLVTKGDLLHQEMKLAASGLGPLFSAIEIVSDKSAGTFERLFARQGVRPAHAAMAGDSMRSDIRPALEAGAWAAYLPPAICWFHERAEPPHGAERFTVLERFADLPAWLDTLD